MKGLGKLLTVFGFLLFGLSSGYAQDKVLGIIIEITNGEKMEFRLVDKPKLSQDGKTIVITADGAKVELTPSELQKVTMGDVENIGSGIAEVAINQSSAEFSDGFVRLSGYLAGEDVRIYNTAGVQSATFKASADGTLTISVSSLPSGISIIKTNKQSIKISKR